MALFTPYKRAAKTVQGAVNNMGAAVQGVTGQPVQPKPLYQRGIGMVPPAAPKPPVPPQAPNLGPTTQAGTIAQNQNLKQLQTGVFGEVQSAGNATNRANALRQYQAIQLSRGNAVRNNLSTEQAQRGQDEALAAANSSNLAATNSVNALQREYGQDALDRADKYEGQTYSRGRDALADSRYETEYKDNRGDVLYERGHTEGREAIGDARYADETTYKRGQDTKADARYDSEHAETRGDIEYARGETKRIEGKQDVNALIASVQDPRAQNLLRGALARGEDVQALYNQITQQGDPTQAGKIGSQYASATPGETAFQAKIDELRGYYPEKSDEELKAMATEERGLERQSIQDPIIAAKKARSIEEAKAKDRSGQPLTTDEEKLMIESGAYKEFTPYSLPTGSDAQSLIGSKVNIGGQVYKVVRQGRTGGDGNHVDHTKLKNGAGQYFFVDKKGMRPATASEAAAWTAQGL